MGATTAARAPYRREEMGSLLSAFFNIAEKWELTTDEQIALLGHPARSTYFKWKKEGGILPRDTLDRISYVLGIHKALRIMFGDSRSTYTWVRKPNSGSMFHGRSAIDLMVKGNLIDLHNVRAYLDAERGGWA